MSNSFEHLKTKKYQSERLFPITSSSGSTAMNPMLSFLFYNEKNIKVEGGKHQVD